MAYGGTVILQEVQVIPSAIYTNFVVGKHENASMSEHFSSRSHARWSVTNAKALNIKSYQNYLGSALAYEASAI